MEISLCFSIFQHNFSIYSKVQSYLIVLLLRINQKSQTEIERGRKGGGGREGGKKFVLSG